MNVVALAPKLRAQRELNPFGLSDVQVQTIQMVVNGYSQPQAARMLNVSLGSVKDRMHWIRLRMGVDTTLQAAVLWVREVECGDRAA